MECTASQEVCEREEWSYRAMPVYETIVDVGMQVSFVVFCWHLS